MHLVQVIAFIVMIVVPFVMMGLNMSRFAPSSLFPGLERWERDHAQAIYWVITMLCGLGVNTGKRTWIKLISFDSACGMVLGSCCWLMSSAWFLDIVNVYVIRLLDLIANFTAFFYLVTLYLHLFPKRKEPGHMV